MRIGAWVISLIVLLIFGGMLWRDYQSSLIVGHDYRFSLVMANKDGEVSFVSFDPTEKRIFSLPFPKTLAIKSRSVGEYTVGSLYKIGEYSNDGGSMVRRKVQGFMRVPIPGYLVVDGESMGENALKWGLAQSLWGGGSRSNLSKLDTLKLLYQAGVYTWKEASEDELVRAGVLESRGVNYYYRADRLQQYVGTRLFDWGIGAEGVTIAVVNESGIDGMGSDMADFINNMGFDVISVKTGTEVIEHNSLVVKDPKRYTEVAGIFLRLLGIAKVEQGEVEAYRSEIVVKVGKDAVELF